MILSIHHFYTFLSYFVIIFHLTNFKCFYFRSLFDFNIEKQISLEQLVETTHLDLQNPKEIEAFLQKNHLLKLNVVHGENEDPRRQRWREKALEVLDEHQVQLQFGDSVKATSILFNSIQGRRLNCGIENDVNTHRIFLFVVSKETEHFGKVLKSTFGCDFMLFKFETPFGGSK